jgi:hypothetical protein
MWIIRIAAAALCAAVLSQTAHAQEKVDPALFTAQSVEGLRTLTAAHSASWRLDRVDRWHMDMDSATIVFSFADGRRATASVQVVGTYNPADGTFLWGWDHPSVPEPLRGHARLVRDFGEEHGIEDLKERKVEVSPERAWEFTALAVRLGGANGGYRADAGGPLVFVTFGSLVLSQN